MKKKYKEKFLAYLFSEEQQKLKGLGAAKYVV
jgi:hypothetical protein